MLLIVIGGAATEEWQEYVHRGLVLLILACPCAIVIATPIPTMTAIAVAAKNGVLIRGSTVIENMGMSVDCIAIDKTCER